MTFDELKAIYAEAYKIIRKERAMRERVFKPGHEKRAEKLHEMDRLLELVDCMKDELKIHLGEGFHQDVLFETPKQKEKVTYP